MRFHCEDNYYLPNLVGVESGKIDQYCFCEDEILLKFILQEVSDGVLSLLEQYPRALEEDWMLELMDRAYKGAKKLNLDPDCCYHYSGKDHGISRGVILLPTVEDVDLFLGKMTTNFGKKRQTRVHFLYDWDNCCLIPNRVLDIEVNDGKVIEKNFSPKTLNKIRKYIEY